MRSLVKFILPAALLTAVLQSAPAAPAPEAGGIRHIPEHEADAYGPLPFPEQVTGFLHHELNYILGRQNKDGSWDSAQPVGDGRTLVEAGGTVGNTVLTAMCGYSLRQHVRINPEVHEEAIGRALRFVTGMVLSGKLRANSGDASWQYIYALRFVVDEYPRVNDPAFKKDLEDACAILVRGLRDCQLGTPGQHSVPFSWAKRSHPGLTVADTGEAQGVAIACAPGSAADAAGIQVGDILLTAGETPVDTAARYAMAELGWTGGDAIPFLLSRKGEPVEVSVKLPHQYPGTLGLDLRDDANGVTIAGFELLSNRDLAPLRVGDRVRKVDGHVIARKADLDKLNLAAGQTVNIFVQRDGKEREFDYVCAPIPAADFGVSFFRGPYDQSTAKGLRVNGLAGGSCLLKAGLKKGDHLLSLDGSLILNQRHFRELSRSLPGGGKVRVSYLSDDREKQVEVTTGVLPDEKWLTGFHGLGIGPKAELSWVRYDSPAELAGCRADDKIVEINGEPVSDEGRAKALLAGIGAGKKVVLTVVRGAARKEIRFTMHRPADSIWIMNKPHAVGGWGYLGANRGGNSFTTADGLRELLKARHGMPGGMVPDETVRRAFLMLGKLRLKQPNSEVESYRYDTGGSFWNVKDIRADVGRLNSAELACVLYTDTGLEDEGYGRTQKHLEKTLEEWIKHRGILDLVKFPAGHGKLSIAPYFWMYSYRTTLEAAEYLTINDALKEEIYRISLKAFFKHMKFYHEPQLGAEGWIIGNDKSKELHDSCQLLDGLAIIRNLYQPRIETTHPPLKKALESFHATRYGEAGRLLLAMSEEDRSHPDTQKLEEALTARYRTRVAELKAIHKEYPRDALRYLEQTKPHFKGLPAFAQLEALAAEWKRTLPAMPKWFTLGPCPGAQEGESANAAWERLFALKISDPKPSTWAGSTDLLAAADPARDALAGKWLKADGQLISPAVPNARIQLKASPKDSYRFEIQFTRIDGHCLAVMFPVGDTAGLLVIGGWAGKVSGIAYLDRKDANRNATTRDGKFTSNEKHKLQLAVNLLDGNRARVTVYLDGKSYLAWEGKRSSLAPDRAWNLRSPGALGLGAYNARIVFHDCQLQIAE